jgi:signal transduction histidine kinase/integral membrane sensor domain MASE1
MTPPVRAARSASIRLAQIAGTFVVFAIANKLGGMFEIENGVSILYPASAVAVLACMYFGEAAAIGVVLGTMVTPWSPSADLPSLFVSGVIVAIEGLIPAVVFRFRRDLHNDLRDMRSLIAFVIFGTIINSAFSAVAGNLLVVTHPRGIVIDWHEVFVWWIADFTGALLLATPILAFGGSLFRRREDTEPRTLSNALQIVAVVILLGWAAAFAIRTYLLNQVEQARFEEQRVWLQAEDTVNKMHANFLRAAFIDEHDPQAAQKLADTAATNAGYVRQLRTRVENASPELRTEFHSVAAGTSAWFAATRAGSSPPNTEGGAHATGRAILNLRTLMERANVNSWHDFAGKRRKIVVVATLVDIFVLLILGLASATLLVNVSRPFRQLRNAVSAMREGARFDASRIDSRYVEVRDLATTLEETSAALKARQEELKLQTERAVAASKHKSEFLAKMSHELRTPLNSIIGFSDLLAEEDPHMDAKRRGAFLENVSSSARHLLDLINDLLDISKVEAGKMPMHFHDVDLRIAIANTVASTAPLFGRKRQEVRVELPEQPMIVNADLGRVEQVLLNLLSNANKFSPEGEPITVTTAADPAWYRIEIRDRGIGISPDDQRRIFDDFEQVQSPGTMTTGTGLGLALAKRFVEAHGGAIEVCSAIGSGSTFAVKLPRVR